MKHAYLLLQYSNGSFKSMKVDMQIPGNDHRIRNLKVGSITTFEIHEGDSDFVPPVGTDEITTQTVTIYPANLALLTIKIVESNHES